MRSLVTDLERAVDRAAVLSERQRAFVARVSREVEGESGLLAMLESNPRQAYGLALAVAPLSMKRDMWGGGVWGDHETPRSAFAEVTGDQARAVFRPAQEGYRRQLEASVRGLEGGEEIVRYRVVDPSLPKDAEANQLARYLAHETETTEDSWVRLMGDDVLNTLQTSVREQVRAVGDEGGIFSVSDDGPLAYLMQEGKRLVRDGSWPQSYEAQLELYVAWTEWMVRWHRRRHGALAREKRTDGPPMIHFPTRTRFDARKESQNDRW